MNIYQLFSAPFIIGLLLLLLFKAPQAEVIDEVFLTETFGEKCFPSIKILLEDAIGFKRANTMVNENERLEYTVIVIKKQILSSRNDKQLLMRASYDGCHYVVNCMTEPKFIDDMPINRQDIIEYFMRK